MNVVGLAAAGLLFLATAVLACGDGDALTVTPPTTTPAPIENGITTGTGASSQEGEQNALEQTRYTVESGDSPLLIAEKVGVPPDERAGWVDEMLALNNVDERSLQVGQELILPPFQSSQ